MNAFILYPREALTECHYDTRGKPVRHMYLTPNEIFCILHKCSTGRYQLKVLQDNPEIFRRTIDERIAEMKENGILCFLIRSHSWNKSDTAHG